MIFYEKWKTPAGRYTWYTTACQTDRLLDTPTVSRKITSTYPYVEEFLWTPSVGPICMSVSLIICLLWELFFSLRFLSVFILVMEMVVARTFFEYDKVVSNFKNYRFDTTTPLPPDQHHHRKILAPNF